MHTILALFDAPVPARGALHALLAAGFAPADIAVAQGAFEPGADAADGPRALPTEPRSLVADLVARDVPAPDAEICAEAVRRGAVLIAVTAPSVAAATARAALDAFGVADPVTHRTRFEADPALRYEWARHAAPVVLSEPAPGVATPVVHPEPAPGVATPVVHPEPAPGVAAPVVLSEPAPGVAGPAASAAAGAPTPEDVPPFGTL